MGKLTDYSIRALKPQAKAYRVADGHGLSLEIRPAHGGRFWQYRYRLDGRATMATLGDTYDRTAFYQERRKALQA